MKKWGKRLGIFLVIILALIGLRQVFKRAGFGKSLGVVEVEGAFWVSDDWVEEIDDFRKDPNIAGVILRIQSPGGTVAASQEIYEAIKRLKAVKPVVASMGTIAASGGLYIAMGAETIVADPGTLTGSIGVKMQHVNLAELLRLARVEYETIKSGRLKDLASFSRPLSLEERGLLENLMAEIHTQFKKVIAEERKLTMAKVEAMADGQIFSGAKALQLGLIDGLGDMGKAIQMTAEKAGIVGEPKLVYSGRGEIWWLKAFLQLAKASLTGPLVCYLYP